MTIRRKTLDGFVQFGITEQYFEKHVNDVNFRCMEDSPVLYSIQRRIEDKTGTILRAHISWTLPYVDRSPSYANKDFPDSWDGFYDACEWLDSKRLEFAESLL